MSDSSKPSDRPPLRLPSRECESELIRDLRSGDERALAKLMRLYWHDLIGFAKHIVEDRDRSEDVVQDVFIRFWIRRADWKRTDTVRPLLYRMVRNAALNERNRLRAARKWVWGHRKSEYDPAPNAQQLVETDELEQVVRRAIDTLPPRRREIFILVRYHGFSHREVGEMLGLSPRTVANQVTHAAQDLKAILDPHFMDRESAGPLLFRRRRG